MAEELQLPFYRISKQINLLISSLCIDTVWYFVQCDKSFLVVAIFAPSFHCRRLFFLPSLLFPAVNVGFPRPRTNMLIQVLFPITEKVVDARRKLSQLVSNHVLRYRHHQVVLAVVNLKLEPDKVGQNRGRPRLRAHRRHLFARLFRPDDWQAAVQTLERGGFVS